MQTITLNNGVAMPLLGLGVQSLTGPPQEALLSDVAQVLSQDQEAA